MSTTLIHISIVTFSFFIYLYLYKYMLFSSVSRGSVCHTTIARYFAVSVSLWRTDTNAIYAVFVCSRSVYTAMCVRNSQQRNCTNQHIFKNSLKSRFLCLCRRMRRVFVRARSRSLARRIAHDSLEVAFIFCVCVCLLRYEKGFRRCHNKRSCIFIE